MQRPIYDIYIKNISALVGKCSRKFLMNGKRILHNVVTTKSTISPSPNIWRHIAQKSRSSDLNALFHGQPIGYPARVSEVIPTKSHIRLIYKIKIDVK